MLEEWKNNRRAEKEDYCFVVVGGTSTVYCILQTEYLPSIWKLGSLVISRLTSPVPHEDLRVLVLLLRYFIILVVIVIGYY